MNDDKPKFICIDCGEEFYLSSGWEKLLEQKPDLLPPKRCWKCRQKRKAEKERSGNHFGQDSGFTEEMEQNFWR